MKKRVFLAIPTTGNVVDSQVSTLRDVASRYADEIELVYPKHCVRRMFHDFARNKMVEEFLESNADCIWFLDSDVTPPRHILDLVTMHWDKWKLAGAPYPVFMTPPGYEGPQVVYTVYKGTSDSGMHPTRIPSQGTDFVDGIATGCLFIKREVLEVMPKPYFAFQYNADDRNITEGEDLAFCRAMHKAGHQFFVDYSMQCGHRKSVCLMDVSNYAMQFAKTAVEQYDKQIRGSVEELQNAVKEKLSQRKERDSLAPGQNSVIWRPR